MYYLKSSGYLLKFRCGDINFNFKNHRNTLSIKYYDNQITAEKSTEYKKESPTNRLKHGTPKTDLKTCLGS